MKRLHRVVWEYYHGAIPKGYHVHHKDNNTSNNDISNLELMEGHAHLRMHGELNKGERRKHYDELRKRLAAAGYYKNWHGSPEGREWHRKHGIEVAKKIKPIKFICEHCGKEFWSKPTGTNRFCSNACKTAWRVKAGLDNETRICEVCGKEFVTNKYYPKRTCSRKCANVLLSQNKKGKSMPQIPDKKSYCVKCGKPIIIKGYAKGSLCDECRQKSIMVVSVCEICGKEFEHSKYHNARFCSPECVGKYNSIRKRK